MASVKVSRVVGQGAIGYKARLNVVFNDQHAVHSAKEVLPGSMWEWNQKRPGGTS
jgi:hypothetical protein